MRRGECTLVLPLHNKEESQGGKHSCFRWSWLLRCRALSFFLRKRGCQKPRVGSLCPPTFPSANYGFASVSQLLYHSGDLILTSTHLFPLFLDQLINLVSSPLHPRLLWFSVVPVRKEVERQLWEGKFGLGSGDILLGDVSSPFACREEVRWGWAVDVGASLIKKEKSRQMGRDVYPGIR